MKDDAKMKENTGVQPMAKAQEMHDMNDMAMPMQMPMNTLPAQMPMMNSMPMTMPAQMPANAMPMETMPMTMPMTQIPMICCPYLMNIQCPMLYGQNMMNPMPAGVSPATGGMLPSMNMGNPQMMGQYQYPMGGM